MEARPLSATKVPRRCLIAKLSELTADRYHELVSESAGALIVLIPQNFSSMPQDVLKQWLEVEPQMLELETNMAVYFVREDEKLLQIHGDIQQAATGDQADSAAEALLSAVYANGFQMVASGPQSKQVKDAHIVSIQGKLSGKGAEDLLPTLAIVTHYDSFGIAPYLAYGVDSNGSGVAAFLELARLFSRLYLNSQTHARFNLLFFLSGGGKFNYQGTKRWIEDNLEVPGE
ncbi:Nicalin-1 [Holothuria leucospilota]|uniref:BOS complex subunit NCLN n=1 Tax=Holothuria leucospilota TaxID=206669 RepID=A0A9Q1H2B1_HOLLE|nr:Nicalin-1 [Holothuria leucospilota]